MFYLVLRQLYYYIKNLIFWTQFSISGTAHRGLSKAQVTSIIKGREEFINLHYVNSSEFIDDLKKYWFNDILMSLSN